MRKYAHFRDLQLEPYGAVIASQQQRVPVQDGLRTARGRQPRLRVDPVGERHIAGGPLLGSEGFRRRCENAPLWIEALRRPPLYSLPPAPHSANAYCAFRKEGAGRAVVEWWYASPPPGPTQEDSYPHAVSRATALY